MAVRIGELGAPLIGPGPFDLKEKHVQIKVGKMRQKVITAMGSGQTLAHEAESLPECRYLPSICLEEQDSCRKAARGDSLVLLLPLPGLSPAAPRLQSCVLLC